MKLSDNSTTQIVFSQDSFPVHPESVTWASIKVLELKHIPQSHVTFEWSFVGKQTAADELLSLFQMH